MMCWSIQVVDSDGNVMYLRHGSKPGCGPVVRFRTRKDAEIALESLTPGLEHDETALVVRAAKEGAGE